jgi:hypothetical protein
MKMLLPLTPEQLARAEKHLLNPPPGSRAEAAKIYGIDLTLVLEQLRLTPDQRARNLQQATIELEKIRGIARRRR